MVETWRVVLASGEVLSVEAWTDADGVPWARHRTTYGEDLACHHTQREAVTRAVALAFPAITEILAPGEPTRAEAVAAVAAERDDARAEVETLRAEAALMREIIAAPDLVAEVRRLTAALQIARREGAEAMRERAANVCERMVVGGCAWSEEQATAARALLDAAGNVRALPLDAPGGVR